MTTTEQTPITAPASARRSTPKWEEDARQRVQKAVRRFQKPLADLIARDANEGDTRLLVTDFLCDALGYDKYEHLTTEYQIKGEFADYGVRVDRQLVALIEVKRVAQKLNEKHLRQVQAYAVNEGVEWMILTNGQIWQVYHLTGGLPVVVDLAFEIDLLGEGSVAAKADKLFHLTLEAMRRSTIDQVWREQAAVSPKSLAQALTSEALMDALRKQIKRETGQAVDAERLLGIVRSDVIRADLLS